MYCRKCGKEINDDAYVCVHCGSLVNEQNVTNQTVVNVVNTENNDSKTGLGVLFSLLLGLIGLIIGICMYPADTNARKTFVKGWTIAFCVSMVVYMLIYAVTFASLM